MSDRKQLEYRAAAVLLATNSLDQEARVSPVGVKTLRNGVLEMDEYIKSLPIQAHSKTEYKRLVTQGANVLPPNKGDGMKIELTPAIIACLKRGLNCWSKQNDAEGIEIKEILAQVEETKLRIGEDV
jgi:hypothetical protein